MLDFENIKFSGKKLAEMSYAEIHEKFENLFKEKNQALITVKTGAINRYEDFLQCDTDQEKLKFAAEQDINQFREGAERRKETKVSSELESTIKSAAEKLTKISDALELEPNLAQYFEKNNPKSEPELKAYCLYLLMLKFGTELKFKWIHDRYGMPKDDDSGEFNLDSSTENYFTLGNKPKPYQPSLDRLPPEGRKKIEDGADLFEAKKEVEAFLSAYSEGTTPNFNYGAYNRIKIELIKASEDEELKRKLQKIEDEKTKYENKRNDEITELKRLITTFLQPYTASAPGSSVEFNVEKYQQVFQCYRQAEHYFEEEVVDREIDTFLPIVEAKLDSELSDARKLIGDFLKPYENEQGEVDTTKEVKFELGKYDQLKKYLDIIDISADQTLKQKAEIIKKLKEKYDADINCIVTKINKFLEQFKAADGTYDYGKKVTKLNAAFSDDDIQMMQRIEHYKYYEHDKRLQEKKDGDGKIIESGILDKMTAVRDIFQAKHSQFKKAVDHYNASLEEKLNSSEYTDKKGTVNLYAKVYYKPETTREVEKAQLLRSLQKSASEEPSGKLARLYGIAEQIDNPIKSYKSNYKEVAAGIEWPEGDKNRSEIILGAKKAVGKKLINTLAMSEHDLVTDDRKDRPISQQIGCYYQKVISATDMLNKEGKVLQHNRTANEDVLFRAVVGTAASLGIACLVSYVQYGTGKWWLSQSEKQVLAGAKKAGIEVEISKATAQKPGR